MHDLLSTGWFWLAAGYLLGSIPFGVLLTAAAGAGNLREIGSGNIGATNVLRTGRKGLAAATLLLDIGKGALAVLLARHFFESAAGLAAIGAFVGHLYPVWLRFRGGKGVATMLGISLAFLWPAGLAFALVWAFAALITRYSSVGGMAGAVAAPVAAFAMGEASAGFLFAGMAVLVLWKHRDNINRLMKGTESRIGQNKADAPGA